MDMKDAARRVDEWITSFDEGYWHPLSLLARLTEEVGELAREINHEYGEKQKKVDEPPGDIGEEMADILFVLLAMANSLQIDLGAAFTDMMDKVTVRDRHRFTPKEKA